MATSESVKRHYDQLVRLGRVPHLAEIEHVLPGIEPRIRQRLATTLAEGGHNAFLQKMAKEIEVVAPSFGNLPQEIFVGRYPTGSFNARVLLTVDGPLILVNTGAEFLIIEVIKLFVAGTFAFVPSAADASHDEISNAIGMNETEIAEQLARLLFAYVTHGDAAIAGKLPILPGADAMIAVSKFAWSTTQFLIAHEYGHVVNDHLRQHKPKNVVSDPESAEFDWMSLEQEVEADISGIRMHNQVFFDQIGRTIDDPLKLIQLQMNFAGPTIFLSIADMIEETFKAFLGRRGEWLVGSHPPTPIRTEYLNNYLRSISGNKGLEFGEVFNAWLDHYKDPVIDFTRRLVLT
jgi:hypothetical protein